MLILPTPLSSFSEIDVPLQGQTYKFTYRWNSRAQQWYLDIADVEGSYYVKGIPIVENLDLTSQYRSSGLTWDGFLMTVATKNTKNPIGRDNFGRGKEYELLFIGYIEF